jgi:CrcB protein
LHLHPSSLLPNAIACLILGFYFGRSQAGANVTMGLLLATGFCGGLSTFSTLVAELYKLIVAGRYAQSLLYTVASLVFGMALFAIGVFLSRIGK